MDSFCSVLSSPKFIRKVLMTGFSSLPGVKENASWEGVNHMDLKRIQTEQKIILARKEVPVVYEKLDKDVPNWIMNHQPHLTIHVGVSPNASCFVLETQAHKKGYELEDSNMCRPIYFQVPSGDGGDVSPETLVSQLDVAAICRQFNSKPDNNLQAKISSDAGRFVCEYLYYTTLLHSRSPTLFVHIPINKYDTTRLAKGLEDILILCLKQLREDDCYRTVE